MPYHKTPRSLHHVLDTWIAIEARPQKVWEMLIDFKSWELWNPFNPVFEGNLQIGEHICIKVIPPGRKAMIFKPEVYEVKPCEKILWGGSFLWFVYRGDHAFLLEPLPGGKTRFRQIKRFRGPMVLFMGDMIEKTEIGYQQMNRAFKRQVEGNK